MLFNSIDFLLFFPIVTVLYFILPSKARWFMLLIASCLFYMAFIPIYILILAVTILIDYLAAIALDRSVSEPKRKFILVASILSTCLVLFLFKYYDFFISTAESIAAFFNLSREFPYANIILPLGLSFHTFQSLSYVIEVYRRKQKPEYNFGIYSLYVLFYPQLVAGPIERPQNLLHQFYEKHAFEYQKVVSGLKLMLWGLFMKVVVADRLGLYVDKVYGNVYMHDAPSLILATYFFAIEIYCDFAGYSNIAIGAAMVMGFTLMTNFNRPYLAQSISEFWHRWHISLSTWFKDYVYIPLGGNKQGAFKKYFNLFIVFVISGLWHGANWKFAVWGALNGFYLVFALASMESRTRLASAIGLSRFPVWHGRLRILVTFQLVCIGWIYFRANNLNEANYVMGKIFDFGWNPLHIDIGSSRQFIYCILAILLLLAFETKQGQGSPLAIFNSDKLGVRWALYTFMVVCVLAVGVFDGGQFIYFQF